MSFRRSVLGCALVTCALSHSSAWGFGLTGVKWEDASAVIHHQFPGVPNPPGKTWDGAFVQAAIRWNSVAPAFKFIPEAQYSHPCEGVLDEFPDSTLSGVGFHEDDCGIPFNKDTLAITYSYVTLDDFVVESDIIYNSNFDWDIYSGAIRPDTMDFRRVTAHELGHLAGLDHAQSSSSLMYAFATRTEYPSKDDIAGINAIYATQDPLESIVASLEEPGEGALVSGVSNIRGWVVALNDISRVEVLIDDEFFADVPYGGSRTDVGAVYPEYPEADDSGFSMALAWSTFAEGLHTITLRVHHDTDRIRTIERDFTVVRFEDVFIGNPGSVKVLGNAVVNPDQTIDLERVAIDGKDYRVSLRWNTASQKFEMQEIEAH